MSQKEAVYIENIPDRDICPWSGIDHKSVFMFEKKCGICLNLDRSLKRASQKSGERMKIRHHVYTLSQHGLSEASRFSGSELSRG
jgi:hypothetical protein